MRVRHSKVSRKVTSPERPTRATRCPDYGLQPMARDLLAARAYIACLRPARTLSVTISVTSPHSHRSAPLPRSAPNPRRGSTYGAPTRASSSRRAADVYSAVPMNRPIWR